VRRTIAGGAGLLVLVLLLFAFRGCLDARKERAIKDYDRDVAALLQESGQQSKSLFDLLSSSGGQNRAVDVENNLNQLRVVSAQLVDRARGLDHPDEVAQPQRFLLETLEFRRDGLAAIADALPTALGDQDRRKGTERVTAEMQSFLASDVIYARRFVPSLQATLQKEGLKNQVRIPSSQFLPNIEWLQPTFVSQRVSRIRTGRGGGPASPGLHGDGLGTVTLGGQTLTPGASATVKLGGSLKFEVQVLNQGQNTETDVTVHVKVGKGQDAIDLDGSLDTIAAGETKTVTIPLTGQPPTGQNVPIEVSIDPVPGEQKTDNNKQTFSVIFTR
jgi:CARDB protein